MYIDGTFISRTDPFFKLVGAFVMKKSHGRGYRVYIYICIEINKSYLYSQTSNAKKLDQDCFVR